MYKQKRRVRQHYPVEFQIQLVNEAEREGVAAVAARYDIHESSIYLWRKRDVGALATQERSPVRASTSLVRVDRLSEATKVKAELAESNAENEILAARCRQLEWLVGKMVSTHPDLAKFLDGGKKGRGAKAARVSWV